MRKSRALRVSSMSKRHEESREHDNETAMNKTGYAWVNTRMEEMRNTLN